MKASSRNHSPSTYLNFFGGICSNEATLFVGDLPPYYKNEDLYNVFAQYGDIEEVRVMGTQCYAFVRFHQPDIAQTLVQRFAKKPLIAAGHELRINLAHGQLPDWKVGSA